MLSIQLEDSVSNHYTTRVQHTHHGDTFCIIAQATRGASGTICVSCFQKIESVKPLQTLLSVCQPALEGDISFKSSAVPDLDCLIIAGTHKEQPIPSKGELIDSLAVLSKVSSENTLRLPGCA